MERRPRKRPIKATTNGNVKIPKLRCSTCSLTDRDRPLMESDLAFIATCIGDGWIVLGYALGLSTILIEHIQQESTHAATRNCIMLMKCKQLYECNSNALTWRTIQENLLDLQDVTVDWQALNERFGKSVIVTIEDLFRTSHVAQEVKRRGFEDNAIGQAITALVSPVLTPERIIEQIQLMEEDDPHTFSEMNYTKQ